MLAVGLFVGEDPVENANRGNLGLFKGGGCYLLGVQILACTCIIVWSGLITFIMLFVSWLKYLKLQLYAILVHCYVYKKNYNKVSIYTIQNESV